MAVGKLTPLADPAPKWFAAVAADQDWPHTAIEELSKYWRHKRERRQSCAVIAVGPTPIRQVSR